MENNSGFRRIAIGIAAEHLKPDSLYLLVHVLELVSNIDVMYKDEEEDTLTKAMNMVAGEELKREATIKCRYYNKGSNQISAPTVRRGETIEVYQYADSNQYYWRTSFYENDLRAREVAVTTWSNIPKDIDDEKHLESVTKENSVWFKVDNVSKKIHFHTPKNDKEPLEWDIEIDRKKGILNIKNDGGDSLTMSAGVIHGKTKVFTIDAEQVILNGKSLIQLKTNKFSLVTALAEIKGGVLTTLSKLVQKGTSSFKAGVKMNKNAETVGSVKIK